MTKKVLVVTKAPFADEANKALEDIATDGGLEVAVVKGKNIEKYADDESLSEQMAQANALVVRGDNVTPEVIGAMPNLELVIRGGAGYNNIDVPYCTENGITVMNTPGQNSNAVAELAFTMAGNMMRKVHLLDPTTKEGKFEKKKYGGRELRGKKLGIHGFGYIGQLVAEIGQGFGMDVYTFDPFINVNVAKDKGVTLVKTMEELYTDSFMVSIHLPKNKDTIGLIDRDLIYLMDDNSVLVNTARAEVIDDDHLEQVLDAKPGFMYAADVHPGGDKEGEKRFARFGDRVLLTPHIGAGTDEANYNCATAAAKQAVAFFKHGDMTSAVNKEVVPPWMKEYAELAEKLGYINAQLIPGQPREVRVIAYDELEEFARPLAGYVLKGMLRREELKPAEALETAEQNQIDVDIRKPHKKKQNAVTIDYFVGENGQTQASSIRGTINEGEMRLSRINDYKNFDFEIVPGIVVMFEYSDKAGLADKIGHAFAQAGYSKTIGRFKPRNGNAMYMFYVEKNDGGNDLTEVRELANVVENKIPEVYKSAVFDFRT